MLLLNYFHYRLLIIVLPRFFTLDGVWMTAPITDFLTACLAGTMLFAEVQRLKQMENEPKISAGIFRLKIWQFISNLTMSEFKTSNVG